MKIAYFPKQTALQSENVLNSFLEGCIKNNLSPVENSMDADTAVIWSVLWNGRMKPNKLVYDHYRKLGKPVFIIEVGSLKRRVTWKVSLNHITSEGIYPTINLDPDRPKKLGIFLEPEKKHRRDEILLTTQHQNSLQWENMPLMSDWVEQKIQEIRNYTNRPIVIRPHPRWPIEFTSKNGIRLETPVKIPDSYDEFDIDFNYHCVINHCSGPSIQAAIAGTPIICDRSSLAYPVSMPISKIEDPHLKNRNEWFLNICHTEWTVDEIQKGIPIKHLLMKFLDK